MLHQVIERWRRVRNGIIGQNAAAQELTPAYVDDLVDKRISKETAEELFTFGKLLFANNDDRIKTVETKALSILGYSSAILAFLVTRSADLDRSLPGAICIAFVGMCAASACVYGWLALIPRRWKALSETTWFPPPNFRERLDEPDDLKRWYIKAMHQMYQENHRITDKKARLMFKGQLSAVAAGLLLGLALIANSVCALSHPTRYFSSESRPLPYSAVAPRCMALYPTYREGSRFSAPCSGFPVDLSELREPLPAWRLALAAVGFAVPCRRPYSQHFDYRRSLKGASCEKVNLDLTRT